MDRESNTSPDVNIEKQTELFIDSSEDEEEYVPQGVIRTSDNVETPRNVSPQLFPQNIIDNPPILQPDQIKSENEAEISLPQGGSTSTNNNTVLSLVNANVISLVNANFIGQRECDFTFALTNDKTVLLFVSVLISDTAAS